MKAKPKRNESVRIHAEQRRAREVAREAEREQAAQATDIGGNSDQFLVRVFPLLEDEGGLTAHEGMECAHVEHADLGEAMTQAGKAAADWLALPSMPRPCAFNIRVQVPQS